MDQLTRSLSETRMNELKQVQLRQKRREMNKFRFAAPPSAEPSHASSTDSEESYQPSTSSEFRRDDLQLLLPTKFKRKLRLRSSDGVIVEVEDEDGTFKLPFLSTLVGYNPLSGSSVQNISVPRVPGDILKRIIDYCRLEVDNQVQSTAVKSGTQNLEEEDNEIVNWQSAVKRSFSFGYSPWLEPWQENYAEVNRDHLLQLLDAAHNLRIKVLLDLIIKAIGKRTDSMSRDELKVFFGLQNEVSTDEYRMIREAFPAPIQDY